MNSLNAKINVIQGTEDISFDYINFNGNNISSSVSEIKRSNQNPFIFGVSTFGDGSKLYDKVDYYISKNIYSSFVTINEYLKVTSRKHINTLTFVFDDIKNIYPKTIYFKDESGNLRKSITVKSPIVTVTNPFDTSSIIDNDPLGNTIEFIGLSKNNSPFIFKGVYSGETIEINSRNIISISRNSSDRADFKLPSFGIISSTSEIEFNDTDGKVLQFAKDQLLKEGLECNIYLKNSLYDSFENDGKLIGVFTTANWEYDNNNRKVSVSLKDDLEEWQDIKINALTLQNQMTLEGLYIYLHGKTPIKYNMLAFDELDIDTQNLLKSITIKYPMLNSGSLWQQWTKLCQVAQAHIYKLDNGKTTFVYRGGN